MFSEGCWYPTFFWGAEMYFYVACRLHGFTLKVQLCSCLHAMMLSSMFRVCLSFFGPVFSGLDMVLLWLFPTASRLVVLLLWIRVSALICSSCCFIKRYIVLRDVDTANEVLSLMKSTEDVSLWDCANAIWCINIGICMLRSSLAKYFCILSSEIDLCPWAYLYS